MGALYNSVGGGHGLHLRTMNCEFLVKILLFNFFFFINWNQNVQNSNRCDCFFSFSLVKFIMIISILSFAEKKIEWNKTYIKRTPLVFGFQPSVNVCSKKCNRFAFNVCSFTCRCAYFKNNTHYLFVFLIEYGISETNKMSHENDIQNFEEWALNLGCPLECLPPKNMLVK